MKHAHTLDGLGPMTAMSIEAPSNANRAAVSYSVSSDGGRPRLEVGARGAAVEALQDQLNELGERLAVDGMFNGRVYRAVVRLQNANGLPPTGVVDEATWDALDAATRQQPTDLLLE
jgi:peptidoglycan hydrolase-like protein with peptidoglycan-binding domain